MGQFNASPSAPRDQRLVDLLEDVQDEIKERLAQSLHRAVDAELLNLGKVLEPHQVRNRWRMEVSIQNSLTEPLSSEMTIGKVFKLPEVKQKLLILGEPGSGKTTTLLELAQTLVERALEDSVAPIPVLVNLSSWKDPQQKIFDWLLGELKSKYSLRQELGAQFLCDNQLLICLDGLDEVAPIRQEACAIELNNWLTGNAEERSKGVVVCCRREEYEKIVQNRLFLKNSVVLQPLSDAQIEAYLNQFQLDSVWENVQASPQLQDLLQKPLFLAVFGFVAPRFDFEEWQRRATDDERMEYLFDRYWDVAMDRALADAKSQNDGMLSKTYGKKKLPDRKKVRRAIVFVAKGMEQEAQTELLIERIQPSWLRQKKQRWQYLWIVGPIFGLSEGLVFGLIFVPSAMPSTLLNAGLSEELISWLIGGPVLGLVFGLVFGPIFGLFGGLGSIDPVEAIKISISHFMRREILHFLRKNLIGGLREGLIFWLIFWLIVGLFSGLREGRIILGLILGLIAGLFSGMIAGFKADIELRITPNQGIKNSRQNMLILAGLALLLAVPFKHLLEQTIKTIFPSEIVPGLTLIFLLIFVLYSFLAGGGRALMQHIALRIVLALHGYAPYRYDKLLDYCTERLLLQRIGGRYRFMHKLLQKHFAKMPLD